jgi:hypothetical protein
VKAKIYLVAAAVVLAVVAITLARGGSPRRKTAMPAPAPWIADQTATTYRIAWHGNVHVDLGMAGAAAQDATVAITGELTLRGLGADGNARRVGVSLSHLDERQLVVMGANLLGDDRIRIDGVEAITRLLPDGSLEAPRFPRGTDATVERLLSAVIGQLAVTVPAQHGRTWTIEESGPSGRARASYEVQPSSGGTIALARNRSAYVTLSALPGRTHWPQTIDARARIVLEDDGQLEALDDIEELHVTAPAGATGGLDSTNHFSIERAAASTSIAGASAPPDETLEAPSAVAPAELRRKLLEEQVAGLTLPHLKNDIALFALTGRYLEDGEWLERSVALMRLHPEMCDELAAQFDDRGIDKRGMGMILDILSSTDNPEAQEAMRVAITSNGALALSAGDRSGLIARFAFLDHPDADSVAMVDALANGDGADARMAYYALGAMAGKLPAAEAAPLHARLRSDVIDADGPAARTDAILALGNAHAGADRALFEQYLHDDDPAVRAAVEHVLAPGKESP